MEWSLHLFGQKCKRNLAVKLIAMGAERGNLSAEVF